MNEISVFLRVYSLEADLSAEMVHATQSSGRYLKCPTTRIAAASLVKPIDPAARLIRQFI